MARQDDTRDLIFKQNCEPVFAAQFAFTNLSATAFLLPQADSLGLTISTGPQVGVAPILQGPGASRNEGIDLLLMASAACFVAFLDNVSGPAVTVTTGFFIGVNGLFQVCPMSRRAAFSVIGSTATGTLSIFSLR